MFSTVHQPHSGPASVHSSHVLTVEHVSRGYRNTCSGNKILTLLLVSFPLLPYAVQLYLTLGCHSDVVRPLFPADIPHRRPTTDDSVYSVSSWIEKIVGI